MKDFWYTIITLLTFLCFSIFNFFGWQYVYHFSLDWVQKQLLGFPWFLCQIVIFIITFMFICKICSENKKRE